jgi:energy-coupling factor transporter ATP-binding protein EcfA2
METGLSVAGWTSQVAIVLATHKISHQVEYVTRQLVRKSGSHEGVKKKKKMPITP